MGSVVISAVGTIYHNKLHTKLQMKAKLLSEKVSGVKAFEARVNKQFKHISKQHFSHFQLSRTAVRSSVSPGNWQILKDMSLSFTGSKINVVQGSNIFRREP